MLVRALKSGLSYTLTPSHTHTHTLTSRAVGLSSVLPDSPVGSSFGSFLESSAWQDGGPAAALRDREREREQRERSSWSALPPMHPYNHDRGHKSGLQFVDHAARMHDDRGRANKPDDYVDRSRGGDRSPVREAAKAAAVAVWGMCVRACVRVCVCVCERE